MDVAGLSDERGTRSVARRVPNKARDRRGRRPQGGAVAALTVHRPAREVEPSAAAAETADRLQASYFLRMLAQRRSHVDQRIGEYQKAIALADAARDAEGAGNLRRLARLEIQDRQTLDGLIENLRRRFPVRAAGGPSPAPRAARHH